MVRLISDPENNVSQEVDVDPFDDADLNISHLEHCWNLGC